MDESNKPLITALMERSARNIKELIEADIQRVGLGPKGLDDLITAHALGMQEDEEQQLATLCPEAVPHVVWHTDDLG